jgi:predicted O-methyltransferase YrrM
VSARSTDADDREVADDRLVAAAVAAVERALAAAAGVADGADGGGWAMAPDAVAFVAALARRCSSVVEFGSGASTAALADAVSPGGRVVSIDNDPDAVAATRAALHGAGLAECAEVVFAPLVARRIDGRHLPVYLLDSAKVADADGPGLIVVDGPPSKLGGREGALRQALSLAGPGTVVVLDDAAREEDAQAFAAVAAHHRSCIQILDTPGFARGLAALVVTAPPAVVVGDDGPGRAPDEGGRAPERDGR